MTLQKNEQQRIDELKVSPLFALSLCSKELAHSNMWTWMMEKYNEFLEVFKLPFNKNDDLIIEREKKNRDITIIINNKVYVIENKLKSLPCKEQLERYEKDVGKKFGNGILTGTYEPSFQLSKWVYISYDDIITRIRNINDKVVQKKNLYDYEVIKHYCSDLENIIKLIKSDFGGKYVKDTYVADCKELEEIRLYDIYLKYQSHLLENYINQNIDKYKIDLDSNWGRPQVYIDFNNCSATVSIVYEQKNGKDTCGRIGVQLQGNQFRIYGGPNKPKRLNADQVFNELKSVGWFEQYNKSLIRTKSSKMKKDYCKYEGKYIHLYQYYTIQNGKPYNELLNEIQQILKQAKDLINNGKVDFSRM